MKKQEFQYMSSDGRTAIHACLWEPEGAPKAVIQIAHGITEHMGRYEEFARYFTGRGYSVAGNDHLGHGLSVNSANPLPMYFGPEGSWKYVVDDIAQCADWLKEKYPGAPRCLVGFSLGSFAVRCLLGERTDVADWTIWAGTGQMKGIELAFAGMLVRMEQRRFGETKDTPKLHKLTMDTYNQRFKPCRTGADWLCANPEAVDEYIADPLCGDGFTVSAFRELLRGMKISGADAHVAKMDARMPVLLISGAEDPVGGFGKGVQAVRDQLARHHFADVEMQLFDGMRHDIFREKARNSVLRRIEKWLTAR